MTWVFGYGSLMWRPGFPFAEKQPATLRGHRRAFCRYSLHHRGTPESPGMVVGLVPGGDCRGYAFRLDPHRVGETLAYLDAREGTGYRRVSLPVEVDGCPHSLHREAWVYLPDEAHPTHVRDLERARVVELIATGHGESGKARDYLVDLIAELARLGVPTPELESVLRDVERYRSNGGGAPAGKGRETG